MKVTIDLAGRQIVHEDDDYFNRANSAMGHDDKLYVVSGARTDNIKKKKDIYHPHNPVISPDKIKVDHTNYDTYKSIEKCFN